MGISTGVIMPLSYLHESILDGWGLPDVPDLSIVALTGHLNIRCGGAQLESGGYETSVSLVLDLVASPRGDYVPLDIGRTIRTNWIHSAWYECASKKGKLPAGFLRQKTSTS